MGAGEGGAGDGMGESFRLRFGRWRGSKCSASFGGGSGVREEVNFVGDSTTKVAKGFANIGWVVVGFIGVLRTKALFQMGTLWKREENEDVRNLEDLLVDLLQSIDTFLEFDVVIWKFSLDGLSWLLFYNMGRIPCRQHG